MTSSICRNGTERVAEAYHALGPGPSVQIPFMITAGMKSSLRETGWANDAFASVEAHASDVCRMVFLQGLCDDDIAQMTPAEAHERLSVWAEPLPPCGASLSRSPSVLRPAHVLRSVAQGRTGAARSPPLTRDRFDLVLNVQADEVMVRSLHTIPCPRCRA